MQKCSIYKVREESIKLFTEAYLSEYVYLFDFANNPFEEYKLHCVYKHVYIDTLEYTSQITGFQIMPCEEFEKHFTLYMDVHQVNKKLAEIQSQQR